MPDSVDSPAPLSTTTPPRPSRPAISLTASVGASARHLASAAATPLDGTQPVREMKMRLPATAVTETGTVSGWTTTHAEAVSNLGNAAAAWAAITQVTSGFARRVFLQSQGDYSQIWIGYPQISNLKRISDVCGEAFTDLFRQRCELGTIYTDLDCYSGNGHIFVQSQHAATFGVITSKTVTTDPSVSRSTCFPDNTSGSGGGAGTGGGGDTCNDYQFIDETDPSGGSTDCSGSGGGGSGDSPGISGGSSSLCYDLELDPGCYDVYVDDVYDSTICC